VFIAVKKRRPWWVRVISFKIAVFVGVTTFVLFDSPAVQNSAASLISKIKPISKPIEPISVKVWIERDYIAMNQYFEQLDTGFSPELIKAIAWSESEWQQFEDNGHTKIGVNRKVTWKRYQRSRHKRKVVKTTYDIGLMQINDTSQCLNPNYWDYTRIQHDPEYNLEAGVAVLKKKQDYVRYLKQKRSWKRIQRRYGLKGHSELEITLKAYNGFQRSWCYVSRVKQIMHEKPWEQEIVRQMEAQGIRKCDGIEYMGDTSESYAGQVESFSVLTNLVALDSADYFLDTILAK
jgi:Transglycosylase SLT domain